MIQTKTTARIQNWTINLRNRVGDVVTYNGSTWLNFTGRNSEPGIGNDWILVDKSSAGTQTIDSLRIIGTEIGHYKDGDVMPEFEDINAFLKSALQKDVPETFTTPTGTVKSNIAASTLYEIGQTLLMNLSTTFNQNDGGEKTAEVLRLNSSNIQSDGSDAPVPLTGFELTITSLTQKIDALIDYAEGTESKTNDLGVEYPNTILAGQINTNDLAYSGRLPYFFGSSSSKPEANQNLINSGTKGINGNLLKNPASNIVINFNVSGEFVWFAIPSTLSKSTYYKTALDNGPLSVIFEDAVEVEVDSPTDFWSGETYNFYISKLAGIHNTNNTIS